MYINNAFLKLRVDSRLLSMQCTVRLWDQGLVLLLAAVCGVAEFKAGMNDPSSRILAVTAQRRRKKSPRAISEHTAVVGEKEERFCLSWRGFEKRKEKEELKLKSLVIVSNWQSDG